MQALAVVYTQASQPCRCRSYGALRLAEVRDGAPPIVVDIEIFISPQRGQVRPVIISRAPEVIPHTTTISNARSLSPSTESGFNQHRERKLARSSPRGTVPILPPASVIETMSGHPTANPYQLRPWCNKPLHGSQTYFFGPLVASPHWPSVASLFPVEPLVARKLLQPGIEPGATA